MYKQFVLLVVTLIGSVAASAQGHHKFDPVAFQRDLEQFITSEAGLLPSEAAAFFPVYREMREKQFAYFGEDRRLRHVDTSDDKACAEAIRKRDANDVNIKLLQQEYHQRFLKILPASKVYLILRAEDKFHRQAFGKMKAGGGKPKAVGGKVSSHASGNAPTAKSSPSSASKGCKGGK